MHKTLSTVGILLIATLLVFGACAPEEVAPAAGGVAPSEEKAAGGVAPPDEEVAGGVVPPAEEEAEGGVVAPPSPEAVSIDIELEVDSTSSEGVKFVTPENGLYEITVVGGASIHLPETDPNWLIYGGWRTRLVLYINKPVEWGNPTEWGPLPINFDYELGLDETYLTHAEAEVANQGANVTVYLDEGDYIIALESDEQDYYYDNNGIITIRITGP